MDDSPDGVEARLRACEDALAALTRRIATLEGAPDTGRAHSDQAPGSGGAAPAADFVMLQVPPIDYTSVLSLTGRTCVVLGGAFLLRALTDAGTLPSGGGVGLGFAYGAAWLGAADYSARRRPASGLVHGLTGVLIGLPLLWEASVRFHLFSPSAGALALAGLTLLALVVAWHRDLQLLAGLSASGAVVTAAALGIASGAMLPNVIFLMALSWASVWLSEARHWAWLKWPASLAASVGVALCAGRAGGDAPLESPAALMAIAVVFVVGVLAVTGQRLIVRRQPVRLFDAVHTFLGLLAGSTVCLVAAPHLGRAGPDVVRASFIVLGAVAYGVAFLLHRRLSHARSASYYYATIGLGMVVWGSGLALAGTARDVMFTVLAVSSGWLATRTERSDLAVHSVVYAVATALGAGLVARSWQIWFTPIALWPVFPLTGWLVLVAALPGALIPRGGGPRRLDLVLSISRLVLAVVLVGGLAGLIVLLLGPAVAGTPPDPGRLASLETVILSCAAVALALVRRLPSGRELGRLAYPVLIAGGVKLIVEDLRVSSPSTLFMALAVYGLALLLTARIGRRKT